MYVQLTIKLEDSAQADTILEVLDYAEQDGDIDFSFDVQRDEIHEDWQELDRAVAHEYEQAEKDCGLEPGALINRE